MKKRSTRTIWMLAAAGLLLAACGDDDGGGTNDAAVPDASNIPDLDGGVDAEPDAGPVDPNRVVCDNVIDPVPGQACGVTAGSDALLLKGTVLGGSVLYENGTVLVSDTRPNAEILCVGCDCADEPEANGATVVSCAAGVISPGLINTHDHITFSVSQPRGHGTERYEHRHDWRLGIRGHTEINVYPSSDSSREGILYGELRMLFGGATSVTGSIGSGNAGGLLRNLDSATHNGGLADVDVDYRTFPLGDSGGTLLSGGCDYPRIDASSRLSASIYMPHIAEGLDHEARNEFTCTSSAAGVDLVESNTSIVHGIGLTAVDINVIAAEGAKLIWSPRSNIDLYGNTAQVVTFANLGATVALGTDWSASGSMNMLRELQCADYLNEHHFSGFFTDRDLWMMATFNAAVAMGAQGRIGVLQQGRVADIAVFDGSTNVDYRAVIDAAPTDVLLVLRGGELLLGNTEIVESILGASPAGCEIEDVCGSSKSVCAQRDAGISMASIRAAVHADSYGLHFCGDPPDEPSCMPTRVGEYTGMSTATDADGDGIDDAEDNCPGVFNPIRVLDGSAQPDEDGDGIGDACDVCPLTATNDCLPPTPGDADGDGVLDVDDNCPFDSNAGQADGDNDGLGDVCDACPSYPSPGGACPATIYDIKQGVVTEGSRVLVLSALVTAVAEGMGFFLQVHPSDPGYAGEDYSGIFVYAAGLQSFPAPGDRLDVEATVLDWYGQIELSGPSVLAVQSTGNALPPPVVVPPADVIQGGARQAALEAALVTVANVSVLAIQPPAGPGDSDPTDEFVVTGGLKVNDYLYLVTPFPAVSDVIASITGVLRWANNDSKLEPRDGNDIVYGPPQLDSITPADAFLLSGVTGSTIPPMIVKMTRAVTADTVIDLAYGTPGVLTGPATVTVLAGQSSAALDLTGVSASATPASVTADDGTVQAIAHVRVYDAAEQRSVVTFEPTAATVYTNDLITLTVTLDLPAAAGGETVDIAVVGGASAPATVTVPADNLSVDFQVTAGGAADTVDVIASLGTSSATSVITVTDLPLLGLIITEVYYDHPSTDDGYEWIKLYNGTSATVDLSTYSLGWGGTDYAVGTLQLTGSLAPGACTVVGGPSADAVNGNPTYGQSVDLNPDLQNGGTAADGVALFDVVASSITASTVPIDAVIYDSPNSNNLMDETGAAGTSDVGDAPAGSSLRLRSDLTWEINPTPTPNLCPPF
ncbi:MAG: amidohydrolase family protein [bacterium]